MRWIGLASAMLAVLLVGVPVASAAKPATLTGKLTGAKLPGAGKGVIPVYAVNLRDGRVAAGTYANRRGRFTLRTPRGSYALLAAIVLKHGRKPLERVADFVIAKPGKRIALKPTLKKRKRRVRHRARGHTATTFVPVDYPAIWVKRWQTPPGELAVMRLGMTDMVITDLSAEIGRCGGTIVEREHLADILGEQKLSHSKYFDPATAVPEGHLIASNATVEGSLSVVGDTATITATYTDQRTGHTGTASVSGPKESLFDLEQQLIPKLAKIICEGTPQTYEGTFSGTATSKLNKYTISWSGSVKLARTSEHGAPPSGWPAGDYAQYVVKSGSAQVKLHGTRGVCEADGQTDIDLVPKPPSLPPGIPTPPGGIPSLPALPIAFVQTRVDEPFFSLAVAPPADAVIPYQETGFGCQMNPQYPLTGYFFAYTPKPLQTQNRVLGGSPSWDRDSFSHFQFGFSLKPTS